MSENKHKSVLVTGASRGIGFATAKLFAENNYDVYANYNKTTNTLDKLAAELAQQGHKLIPLQADVSKKAEVDNMIARTGGIDILVNNAGIAQFKQFIDIEEADWDTMMEVDLKSTFLCTQGVIRHMIHNKWGKIINISSMWGITGGSCEVHYSTAKAGIIGFTKSLAKEMGPSGIQVNCLAPGVIDTDMNSELTSADIDALKEQTPLGKIGLPYNVAKAALFLAEDDFITGEVLNINGGLLI